VYGRPLCTTVSLTLAHGTIDPRRIEESTGQLRGLPHFWAMRTDDKLASSFRWVLGLPVLVGWLALFVGHRRNTSPWWAVGLAVWLVFLIALCVGFAWLRPKLWIVAACLVGASSLSVTTFGTFYWLNGTTTDFNHTLSHLDALYFSMGTLSTAGTGTLAAISQKARLIQTIQMGLDFVLIVGTFGALLGRYVSRSDRTSPEASSRGDGHHQGR
jgi:Ion channel